MSRKNFRPRTISFACHECLHQKRSTTKQSNSNLTFSTPDCVYKFIVCDRDQNNIATCLIPHARKYANPTPTTSPPRRIGQHSLCQALAEEQATQLYDAGVGKFVGTGKRRNYVHCRCFMSATGRSHVESRKGYPTNLMNVFQLQGVREHDTSWSGTNETMSCEVSSVAKKNHGL